jgi:hypothetical protein
MALSNMAKTIHAKSRILVDSGQGEKCHIAQLYNMIKFSKHAEQHCAYN